MTQYKKTSPWYRTPQNTEYLEVLVYRKLPMSKDDVVYTIENQYKHRPDLLANDLYGSSKYWWVFTARNREKINDPIYDFVPGLQIRLPIKENLLSALRDG